MGIYAAGRDLITLFAEPGCSVIIVYSAVSYAMQEELRRNILETYPVSNVYLQPHTFLGE